MRCLVLAGVALYLGLLAMAFGLQTNGVHGNAGRVRGVWSDLGMLATLLVAAPAVVLWALAAWRRYDPDKKTMND